MGGEGALEVVEGGGGRKGNIKPGFYGGKTTIESIKKKFKLI